MRLSEATKRTQLPSVHLSCVYAPIHPFLRRDMMAAAEQNGLKPADVKIVNVEVPPGSIAVHHQVLTLPLLLSCSSLLAVQDLWHGSGKNSTADTVRYEALVCWLGIQCVYGAVRCVGAALAFI
jgi:hypothetical protein